MHIVLLYCTTSRALDAVNKLFKSRNIPNYHKNVIKYIIIYMVLDEEEVEIYRICSMY